LWKCLAQYIGECSCTYACIEKIYTPPETPKLENEVGDATMDFGDLKMK
jgi:hypothetical protein